MAAQTYASEIEELGAWVTGVAQLPAMLRTKDAKTLLARLGEAGFDSAQALLRSTFDDIAAIIGRTRDGLLADIRKCPFGVSF